MKNLTNNRYAQAALIAFVTGFFAALAVYAGTMTDGLDMRHTVKNVLLAFIGGFTPLLAVLPKISDLVVPTVRVVSAAPISEGLLKVERPNEVITHDADTTITVGNAPVRSHQRKTPVPPVAIP